MRNGEYNETLAVVHSVYTHPPSATISFDHCDTGLNTAVGACPSTMNEPPSCARIYERLSESNGGR